MTVTTMTRDQAEAAALGLAGLLGACGFPALQVAMAEFASPTARTNGHRPTQVPAWERALPDLDVDTLCRTLEAEAFLRALWGSTPVPPDLRGNAWLVLVTKADGGGMVPHWYRTDELDRAAADAVRWSDDGQDVYVGLGLVDRAKVAGSGRNARGTKQDVLALPGAWADVDVSGPTHKSPDLPPTREAALEATDALPPPTIVVDSGSGLHLYWLADGAAWSPRDEVHVEGLQHALREEFGTLGWSLDGTADATRILRVPGTWNWKAVRLGLATDPVPVTLLGFDPDSGPETGPRYQADDFPVIPRREGLSIEGAEYSGPGDGTEFGRCRLDELGDRLRNATPGNSNATLLAVTSVAGKLVRAGQVRLEAAQGVLGAAAEARIEDDLNAGERARSLVAKVAENDWAWTSQDGVGVLGMARVPDALDEAFWNSRPVLRHIRQAAYARMAAPHAVLEAVLTRVAAFSPHELQVDAGMGPVPLSYCTLLVGKSGDGKGVSVRAATDLVPTPDGLPAGLPAGSGEGLVDAYLDGSGRAAWNALMVVDEGEVLAALGSRAGNTFMANVRTMWTGAQVGSTNAKAGKRNRLLAPNSYVLGLIVLLQPKVAGEFLAGDTVGTPQRFSWAFATDPSIPDDGEWPGPLDWKPVSGEALGDGDDDGERPTGWYSTGPVIMPMDPEIRAEIRRDRLAAARGLGGNDDSLGSHRNLLRLKRAAALALLEGRTEITLEDWRLSTVLQEASDAACARVQGIVAAEAEKREAATSGRLARRAGEQAVATKVRLTVHLAEKVARKVHRDPERFNTVRAVRRSLAADDRPGLDDALEHAVAQGWILVSEESTSSGGEAKRTVTPGTTKVPG